MENKYDDIIVICGESKITLGIDVICIDCKKPLWMSDSSINSVKQNNPGMDLEKHPPTVLCMDCGTKRMEQNSNEERVIALPTPEQVKELKDYFKNGNNRK